MLCEADYWLIGNSTISHFQLLLTHYLDQSSHMERMPFAEQDAEEQFDRQMLKAIETTVISHLGDLRVSDSVTVRTP